MKKYLLLTAVAVIVIILGLVIFYKSPATSQSPSSTNLVPYTAAQYGFSFNYPDNYLLTEQTSTGVDSIVLTRKEDLPLPQNSEAPPTITIDVYPNPSSTTLIDWLSADSTRSNYLLPNTATSTTIVAGNVPAIGYLWEGLYFGLSVAFEHNNNVIILTGMYNDPSDQILKDFQALAASVKVQ